MPDKRADFVRINQPRFEDILKRLTLIDRSARSMGVVKTMQPYLDQIEERLQELRPAAPKPVATKPVANEAEQLESLSTTQLVDRMIACGAILAARRK